MDKYSHRERIAMILAGDTPDRYAASFWRHFFHMEHSCEGTVEAMLAYQKEFDWDFMKINPRADYHTEDWGLRSEWSHDEFSKHKKLSYPVKTADDWLTIDPNPATSPALAEHLKVVAMIRKKSDRELPLLMTVFTPLAIAGRLIEDKKLLVEHLRSEPEKVEHALRAITATFKSYVSELRNAGADGLFFATLQWASSDWITWEEYQRFGVPYDLEVIHATEGDALNLFHVCSDNNYLEQLAAIEAYNCRLYNWDCYADGNLNLEQARSLLGKGRVAVGGVEQELALKHNSVDQIAYAVDELKDRHPRTELIIGPGCVVPPEVSNENLHAVRNRL
jgi:uroporphyrinogen decarboxylase